MSYDNEKGDLLTTEQCPNGDCNGKIIIYVDDIDGPVRCRKCGKHYEAKMGNLVRVVTPLCVLGFHRRLYWRTDAHFRFCSRCDKWWHLNRYGPTTEKWVRCDEQLPALLAKAQRYRNLPADYCTVCDGSHDENSPHTRYAPGDDPEWDSIRGLA